MPTVRATALALALLAALPSFAALDALAADAVIAFSPPVRVGPNIGEPGLRIGPDDTIWVHYPGGMRKSRDGGASWSQSGMSPVVIFGGDADLTILRDGNLVYADLSGVAISTIRSSSPNGAFPWIENPVASNLVQVDRQWVDSGPDPNTGTEVVYLAYNQIPTGMHVWRSDTGGVLFEARGTLPALMGFNCFRGNIDVSQSDGFVYAADCASTGPRVWRSFNGGLTWTVTNVDYRQGGGFSPFLFQVVDTDAAGNVYVVWTEREGSPTQSNTYVSGSNDLGLTWTPKLKLTTPASAGGMAWVAAGSDGRVGVAWQGASMQGNVGSMPDSAQWFIHYAVITDFFGPNREVTATRVSDDEIQRGFICGSGTGCNGGRNLLDFFQVQVDAAGRANVVYADGCDGCTSPATSRRALVTFARQSSGPLLVE